MKLKTLVAAMTLGFGICASAQNTGPVKIGFITDMASVYADIDGPAGGEMIKWAAQDFGGKVLNRPIEVLTADHQNKADVAANKARDYRERQQAAKRGGGQTTLSLHAESPETGLTLDPPDDGPSPDEILLSGEQATQVRAALDRLGDPCKEIIELRYFGDLSYEEISRELKLNPKTVSSRLSKCLDRLEEIVRKYFSRGKSQAMPSNY